MNGTLVPPNATPQASYCFILISVSNGSMTTTTTTPTTATASHLSNTPAMSPSPKTKRGANWSTSSHPAAMTSSSTTTPSFNSTTTSTPPSTISHIPPPAAHLPYPVCSILIPRYPWQQRLPFSTRCIHLLRSLNHLCHLYSRIPEYFERQHWNPIQRAGGLSKLSGAQVLGANGGHVEAATNTNSTSQR